MKATYHQIELYDKLPDELPDHSVDIIYTVCTGQYFEHIFDIVQSTDKKLKP